MNQQNAAEFEPFVIALKNGETIQFQATPLDKWKDVATMDTRTWRPRHFRVKPKPRVFEGLVHHTMLSNGELKWIAVAVDGYQCEPPKPGTQFRLTEIL